ncbi:MAG TPA: hypothetical protein PLV82_03790 [bacterium]|jgi:hypothetical protein|nr:hypothetical protein [bacterium]
MYKKLSNKGIAHLQLIIVGVFVVLAIGGVGSYVVSKSQAGSPVKHSAKIKKISPKKGPVGTTITFYADSNFAGRILVAIKRPDGFQYRRLAYISKDKRPGVRKEGENYVYLKINKDRKTGTFTLPKVLCNMDDWSGKTSYCHAPKPGMTYKLSLLQVNVDWFTSGIKSIKGEGNSVNFTVK